MYKRNRVNVTTIDVNKGYEGERIEEKIERIVNNKEAITDGAPAIYTERRDGVVADYNIRTDRFEIAIDAMDKVAGAHQAKREERLKPKMEIVKDGEAEPTQTTKKGGTQ